MEAAAAGSFAIGPPPELHGESDGEGPPIVLCHGITATRRYVVHGSRALERAGHTVIAYDARGHGESDPTPRGEGYGYPVLVDDLERVIADRVGEGRFVLAGHSMGAHTTVSYALRHPERLAGLVVIGPVYTGQVSDSTLSYWDGLAEALERGGVDGFVSYIGREQGIDPAWRETVLGFTRTRMLAHHHPEAVAEALREVPRSRPFGDLAELGAVEVPALVVASGDEADPGHPFGVGERWAEALGDARLRTEEPGKSPLAWQGGQLSKLIADLAGSVRHAA
jgi:pimeloyl-ACP methyl ester carboxylesterase